MSLDERIRWSLRDEADRFEPSVGARDRVRARGTVLRARRRAASVIVVAALTAAASIVIPRALGTKLQGFVGPGLTPTLQAATPLGTPIIRACSTAEVILTPTAQTLTGSVFASYVARLRNPRATACTIVWRVALMIADAAGHGLPIAGNGGSSTWATAVVPNGTTSFIWAWNNWCGPYRGPYELLLASPQGNVATHLRIGAHCSARSLASTLRSVNPA